MPPQLALLACLVFILILFGLDTRLKSQASTALWIPTLWVLIIGSRPISQWFGIGATRISTDIYLEGSPLDRNIYLVLIVTALVIVIARGVRFSQVVKANGWVVLFFVYCGISITWSDFPDVSFKRYIKDIGNVLMVLIVLSESAPVEAIITVFKRCSYALIPLSVVMIKYYPAFGRSYSPFTGALSVTGVTNNKNTLGAMCAVCGIGIFWNLVSMWRSNKISSNKIQVLVQSLMLILTIRVLIMSHSATSLVCFVIATGIITAIKVKAVRRSILYTLPLTLFLLLSYLIMSDSMLGIFTGMVGRDETFTGRTEIWHKAIGMVQNPIIGGGYSSFWLGDRLNRFWDEYTWGPTEAHNGYLEVYLDLGIIGIILLVGILISSLRAIVTLVRSDLEIGALKLTLLVSAILYNVTESAFRAGLLMYFVFALVVIQLPRPVRKLTSNTSAPPPRTRPCVAGDERDFCNASA